MNLSGLINNVELNDLNSIQKAIQYFPIISEVERQQTAIRITNALYRLQETINVGSSNLICKYLKPGSFVNSGQRRNPQHVFIIVPNKEDVVYIDSLNAYVSSNRSLEDGQNPEYDRLIDRFFSKDIIGVYNPASYNTVIDGIEKISNHKSKWLMINNTILNYCNKKIISLMKDAGEDTYQVEILNAYFIDLIEAMIRGDILSTKDMLISFHSLTEKLEWLPLEALGVLKMLVCVGKFSPDMFDGLENYIEDIRIKIGASFLLDVNCVTMVNRCAKKSTYGIIPQMLYNRDSYIEEILENSRRNLEDELNRNFGDILYTKRYTYHYNEIKEDSRYTWLHNNLEYFSGRDLSKFKQSLDKKLLKLRLFDTQIYALKKAGIVSTFIHFPSQDMLLGVNKKTCYILASNMDKIYMFPIFNGNETDKIRRIELMMEPITARVIEFKNDKALDFIPTDLMVIEATNKIEFDTDANINFKFKRADKNTYMNRYADIHSILVENGRNKNYNAMKTDLCRLYALVYIIERDVTHTTKAVSPSVKADGSKARMFAKNDLKRYLAEVTSYEKDFDLAKYFNESTIKKDIEKEYDVKINTLGVTKLLKTII